MPDVEKRARATWVVDTQSVEYVTAEIGSILAEIRSQNEGTKDA
jgi:hypothetical protein